MKLRNKTDGKELLLPPKAIVAKAIIQALGNDASKTTHELSKELGKTNCYSSCMGLKKKGILKSMTDVKYSSWDPITKQVITEENYDAIMTRDPKAIEEMRQKLKADGLSEDEIADKLRDEFNPRSIKVSFITWWLSSDWEIVSA